MQVRIITADGKIYTDPTKVRYPRTENTEAFYRFLENFKPKKEDKTA
ncbi:hypothetical protein ACTQ6A_02885 [Lachnospiraceae bacterium LCP25S3_G4]